MTLTISIPAKDDRIIASRSKRLGYWAFPELLVAPLWLRGKREEVSFKRAPYTVASWKLFGFNVLRPESQIPLLWYQLIRQVEIHQGDYRWQSRKPNKII